jgi:hypothetical protein
MIITEWWDGRAREAGNCAFVNRGDSQRKCRDHMPTATAKARQCNKMVHEMTIHQHDCTSASHPTPWGLGQHSCCGYTHTGVGPTNNTSTHHKIPSIIVMPHQMQHQQQMQDRESKPHNWSTTQRAIYRWHVDRWIIILICFCFGNTGENTNISWVSILSLYLSLAGKRGDNCTGGLPFKNSFDFILTPTSHMFGIGRKLLISQAQKTQHA